MVLVRRAAMLAMVGISDATRHRLETLGKFPARVQVTAGIVAWNSDELEKWVLSRGAVTAATCKTVAPGCAIRGRKTNAVRAAQAEQ